MIGVLATQYNVDEKKMYFICLGQVHKKKHRNTHMIIEINKVRQLAVD